MSATHRVHPNSNGTYRPVDPPDAILWDDCERCDEHATDALGLDRTKLRAAWDMMIAVETGGPVRVGGAEYRTANEARLGRLLYNVYVITQRLAR